MKDKVKNYVSNYMGMKLNGIEDVDELEDRLEKESHGQIKVNIYPKFLITYAISSHILTSSLA